MKPNQTSRALPTATSQVSEQDLLRNIIRNAQDAKRELLMSEKPDFDSLLEMIEAIESESIQTLHQIRNPEI